MADTINRQQAGISLGALFGVLHLAWILSAAVAGNAFIRSVESMHFLSTTYTTTAFNPLTAVSGLFGAVVAGYVIGWIFAYIYNETGEAL